MLLMMTHTYSGQRRSNLHPYLMSTSLISYLSLSLEFFIYLDATREIGSVTISSKIPPLHVYLLLLCVCESMYVCTLEELGGHGLIDEFRGSVHQSHGSLQVVVHHCHMKRRLTKRSWRTGVECLESHPLTPNNKTVKSSRPGLTSLEDVGGCTTEQLLDTTDTVDFSGVE